MDPVEILKKHCGAASPAFNVLLSHGSQVAGLSTAIAEKMALSHEQINFIREAALLHDIGVIFTDIPKFGANGLRPYLCHGYLGRELLEAEGLPGHALVAERHVGCGITVDEIVGMGLPLPRRDMVPVSLEEKIICYADKFFSKKPPGETAPQKTETQIINGLAGLGREKPAVFLRWKEQFGLP